MIRSLIFSMLIFGLWELSPAAVSVGGQQQQAQKKQVQKSKAKEGKGSEGGSMTRATSK